MIPLDGATAPGPARRRFAGLAINPVRAWE